MKGELLSFLTIMIMCFLLTPVEGGIVTTKHNLSVSGPGSVRAAGETEICIFCHTTHNASPRAPLWNRWDAGSNYTPYYSSTTVALPGQPTGSSLLCLSCHDGTIALGQLLSKSTSISMVSGSATIPTGPGRLGTNLSDDHPISITYTGALASQNGQLMNPLGLPDQVKLDKTGQLQCSTCHNAHNDTFKEFLVMSNRASALCTTCHTKHFWDQTIHKTSTATWNRTGPNPWPHTSWTTVSDNGCENCHRPHTAGGHQRLLNYAVEENNCYPCHNGNVAPKNIQTEFAKTSRHPVEFTTGTHDPTEPAIVAMRHVECVDCHNPHAATSSAPGNGVRGVNISGSEIASAFFEYEICFRCHADSVNKLPPRTTRQISQTNVRLEFHTGNPSFHPVAGPGVNPNVPSLIAPYTTASVIKCGDCHNNNAGIKEGGAGPNGPHGSLYPPILIQQYVTTDNNPESASAYALCYKCHSRSSILNDVSFKEHKEHIHGENTPCNVCHDPHGVSRIQGNSTNNSKLINFDTTVCFPSSSGKLRFESQGIFKGACYLRCHGEDHDPKTY